MSLYTLLCLQLSECNINCRHHLLVKSCSIWILLPNWFTSHNNSMQSPLCLKTWPIRRCCQICPSSFTLLRTSSLVTFSSQLIFPFFSISTFQRLLILPSIVHVAAARWLEIDRKLRMYFSLQIHVDLAAAPESFIVLLGKSKRPPSPGTAWDYLRCLLSLHATKAQRLFRSRHSGIDKLWDVLDSPMFGELPDTRITAGEGRGVNRGVAVTSLLPIRSIYHPTSWNQWKAKRRKARKLQRLKKLKKAILKSAKEQVYGYSSVVERSAVKVWRSDVNVMILACNNHWVPLPV